MRKKRDGTLELRGRGAQVQSDLDRHGPVFEQARDEYAEIAFRPHTRWADFRAAFALAPACRWGFFTWYPAAGLAQSALSEDKQHSARALFSLPVMIYRGETTQNDLVVIGCIAGLTLLSFVLGYWMGSAEARALSPEPPIVTAENVDCVISGPSPLPDAGRGEAVCASRCTG